MAMPGSWTDLQTEQPQLEQVRGSKSTSDIRTWVKEVLQEPAFPFKTSSLTQLGDIRARHSANNRTRIEVLACVTSKQNRRSPFERVREFILQDATNRPYTLKSRKEDYDAGHIRIGDIVSAALEITYKEGLLELSYLPWVTQMQIYWRMNPKKQGDTAYRFDRAVADTSAEAKAVLKITLLIQLPHRSHAVSSTHLAMPPKAAASKRGKRKVESTSPQPTQEPAEEAVEAKEEEQDDDEDKPKKAKRAKKAKEPVKPIDPSVPTNLTVPDDLEPFPRPPEGCIRISAWNVAGLRASEKKGFSRYVNAEDADILVVTETKTPEMDLPALNDRYEYRYWGDHAKKGHAGTAIFSKIKPLNVTRGFQASDEVSAADSEGRMITLEFENTYLVGTYVPNAGAGLKTLPEKEKWNRAFETYLRELDAKKPVIWCGDLNVVATPIDIRNWKTNYNKSAGCTDSEINAFKAQLNPEEGAGHQRLVDVWRERNPELEGHYSYYSYKFSCREKGIGWRLDYHVVSERILPKVKSCEIRAGIWGASDHVPLILDIEGPV
ncbi:hypothetical protein B0A53_01450 [Rhodotorula sp. CCFEE 5036]|nr:hypothetical protein B0A53_01450 [Rhodotorula sp. CCFEE 5036]